MSKRSFFVRLVPCRCLRGEEEAVTSLDYSHCSLETVPKEIFNFEKTLQELYLDANQIEELPKQLFNCQLLNRLSMPDNDISVLPAAIANLINLRELDVSKNSIQEFPENIKNCKVLAIVEASVNPIAKLPEGFTQLLSLTQLYLNDAFLEFLPASFGRLTKLQILELRENQLKMLPKSMQKLTQLERLDLGSNEFTEVPEVLKHLSGLKELWMDGNKLTFLPGMLGMMKQLLYLDVSKNNLEMVDENISGCENLQDLLLSSNALTQLPGSIGSFKKLTTLKVDENQLMYLPDSIGGLTSIDELDCSFNEIEALPSSVGQCVSIRTFAADHNFLSQLPPELGNWKSATVLFLHSNKLESLPEEMGDMQRLKVINLSNNKLKNLPYSFTQLSEMTAMWLSENQSKPLIPLQKEEDPETHKTVLTNYMFPQQTRTDDFIPNSDSESFNPALWEEQRKQRAQVAFECDEDKDERETPPREGNLKRYPTPYPDELKNMVKTAQSVAHRLKEDETSDESGKESKPVERNHIGVQDVGVKVIEAPCPNGVASDIEPPVSSARLQNAPAAELKDTLEPISSQIIPFKSSEGSVLNHEDTLEDTEELSEEEEMKIAEMRPPLIEISINQPKVVTLSKDKKDDGKDADSLLDDTVANSNQNNSNCSSPSRMSDSVSLTTDSSQDNSLCTPERESKMPFLPKSRQDDENMNQPKDTTPLLHNGNGSEPSLQALLKTQQTPPHYDLAMEAKLAFIEKEITNGMGDAYTKWDQINMNVTKLPAYHTAQFNQLDKAETGSVEDFNSKQSYGNDNVDHTQNGNQLGSDCINSLVNRSQGMRGETSALHAASPGMAANSDISLSRSTEELSPEKRCHPPQVMKSHSISNIETGGMKLYSFDGDDDAAAVTRMTGAGPGPGAQGQNIVRSKSASQLLNDQSFLVYPGSSTSSSDLLSASKPHVSTSRYPPSSTMSMGAPPPQYNIQYASSAIPKDGPWAQRAAVPLDHQGYLPPHPHSLANTNFSNRNQAPPYPLQPQQRGPPMAPIGDWTKERLHSTSGQPRSSTLQRQSSSASSVSMGDPRRIQVPEGEYMTYRDINTLARGPLAMSQALQRPFSARTYSIDAAVASRPVSARPQPRELPERTMSVSDFNYQQSSPSKQPNTRVKSEHSLLDGPGQMSGGMGPGRVPTDWRDQVMRHIEAKKMEKDDVFVPQGPQSYTMDPHRKVPLMNGQMGPSVRPQISMTSMTRHPSREQLIDYLMLKVSQQPHGPPRIPHDMLRQEIRVKVEKNPELGFSISGGVGGRGNPFRPDDNGIFVTRVQPEGPASKILQPGDRIIQANGYNFVNIDHGNAVSLLKTFPTTVDLIIIREVQA
ncbi:erbin isoform X2 [Girardinichthys multiradiatus]|uniref:erbin isoform X2 n=1 Tax=Girardinichthys multiradiatus TaxID=208333 RepID=UPI001FABB554|nr:erbin isoform X2 [Girardinichthys multiradiatus]